MNSDNIFKTIFFVLFVILLFIRLFYGLMVRKEGHSSWSLDKEAVKREGKLSILMRPLIFLVMLVVVVLYAISPAASFWLVVSLPDWLRWLGAVVGAISLPLLIWVHQTLREYWSTTLQLRKSHSLITQGPYSWVRHPMYSVLMLNFIGLSLVSAIWLFILLAAISPILFNRIAVIEEKMMLEQFGDDYSEYMKYTGRFLPRRLLKTNQNVSDKNY